ncbi:HAMP domain-containing methyl-accepting chemotaxis protein [Aliarcobacter butzleri]|uniref:HAMP domain-containing methyl-accepting chemotaxis protein n=1 Tax=Aliarcobacter butzleri TaxID=28197 RepID=UPI0021B1DA7B|nr:methyl-accepting chemotaxis protein [Aliarcobacter butzleri]UWY61404.1 methyl-accepting chemotaxis protein [Aliarcobacter butzleri]
MLANLTIKKKLIFSFSIIIVLIFGFVLYATKSINETADGFSEYRRIAKNAKNIASIDIQILKLNSIVLEYIKSHQKNSIDEFDKEFENTKILVDLGIKSLKNPKIKQQIEDIDKSLDSYKNSFSKVINYMQIRDSILKDNLYKNGKKLEEILSSAMTKEYENKNNENSFALSKLLRDILIIRTYVLKFVETNSNDDYEIVNKEIEVIGRSLENIKSMFGSRNSTEIKEFENILKSYEDGVTQLYETINTRNSVISNELNVFTKNIQALAHDVLVSQSENQDTIGAKVDSQNSLITIVILIVGLIILIFAVIISITLSRNISNLINTLQTGLLNFFAYLNREKTTVEPINLNSEDEFGVMAKVVNENILKTQKGIEEDRKLIDETIAVLSEFEQGDLCQRLNIEVSNPALMQLKNVLNLMGENLESNVNNVLDILEQYSNHNYLNKIDQKGIKEHLLKLANGVNNLGESITSILIENKSNGLTLENSSSLLLENVDRLNISSNEAAASLEETAAALEEITSNIRNTTGNIAKMATYSNEITKASSEGEKLATQTNQAMDEINTQVNLVNDAISVIDQIAFQTNILSLNAAVEAATAGEAGKGFAVVAQEVRNLASRSAEAAKEIKDIVENATKKANEGKDIANEMIEGYKGLNDSISQTINLISDVEMSSKEQLLGIEQINDAVNSLDQQTQQNAMVASQSNDIAVTTDKIAKLVVSNANAKEFKGKNEVKAKDVGMKKEVKEHIIASTPKKIVKTSNPSKPTSNSIKEITSSLSDDEWESF